jgi:hypothetical protein
MVDGTLADLGVALVWIAMSAACAKGLSVLARAAATNNAELELVPLTGDTTPIYDGPRPVVAAAAGALPRLSYERS